VSRRPPLSRDPQEAVIDGFTHGGEGVARIEGKAVFVPGALPGERVRAAGRRRPRPVGPGGARRGGAPSPDRVDPPCPYVPACGGCDLQHARPAAQRALKTRVVREQLERLGGITDPPVADCLAVGPDLGYRTHAQLHAAPDGRLGFHRAGSHDVVPIDRCLVLTDATQAVRDEVGDDTGAVEVAVRAHERTHRRGGADAGAGAARAAGGGRVDLLLAQPDGRTVAIRGDGMLEEQVAGLTYRFHADAFFQVTTTARRRWSSTSSRRSGTSPERSSGTCTPASGCCRCRSRAPARR
jgi:tRNA/tmRNA/rRNA uracil-C5-methylase (TrmA/RlmC/RlmD family)